MDLTAIRWWLQLYAEQSRLWIFRLNTKLKLQWQNAPARLWSLIPSCIWHLRQIIQCCFVLLAAVWEQSCRHTYIILQNRTSIMVIWNRGKRGRQSPEGEGDDGARLSLTHCDGNPLMFVHQVVLIWITVNIWHCGHNQTCTVLDSQY